MSSTQTQSELHQTANGPWTWLTIVGVPFFITAICLTIALG